MNAPSAEQCSHELLELALAMMRQLREEDHGALRDGMTWSQFRMLFLLRRVPDASLGQVAERLGLAPATCSQMIDGLVGRELVSREASREDRRRVVLRLTPAGEALLAAHRADKEARLAGRLAGLSEDERRVVHTALTVLGRVMTMPRREDPAAG